MKIKYTTKQYPGGDMVIRKGDWVVCIEETYEILKGEKRQVSRIGKDYDKDGKEEPVLFFTGSAYASYPKSCFTKATIEQVPKPNPYKVSVNKYKAR